MQRHLNFQWWKPIEGEQFSDRVIIVVVVDNGLRGEDLPETVHLCLSRCLQPVIKLSSPAADSLASLDNTFYCHLLCSLASWITRRNLVLVNRVWLWKDSQQEHRWTRLHRAESRPQLTGSDCDLGDDSGLLWVSGPGPPEFVHMSVQWPVAWTELSTRSHKAEMCSYKSVRSSLQRYHVTTNWYLPQ